MIDRVESMVVDRIKDWVRNNKFRTPKNVIYYRDGVSEAQYKAVRDEELTQIRSAFGVALKELRSEHRNRKFSDEEPKLTAIVCAKRHHVRFYPNDGDSTTHNGNCLPGTYVDDVVTSPYYADFYLQSHTPMHGTARPAHYFILCNDMDRSTEELRQFVGIDHTFLASSVLTRDRPTTCASHTSAPPVQYPTLLQPTTLIVSVSAVVATFATSLSTLHKGQPAAISSANSSAPKSDGGLRSESPNLGPFGTAMFNVQRHFTSRPKKPTIVRLLLMPASKGP